MYQTFFQSHLSAIPTYACMKNRSLKKFAFCSALSMILCFLSYTIAGIFGYIAFGTGQVPSDILQGYTDQSLALTVALVAVAVKLFTTYPIVLYCGRDALLDMFGFDSHSSIRAKITATLVWFVSTLALAIFLPDISPMISMLGTLSAAFIFIFPGICLLQSTLLKDPQLFLNKDRFFIFAAICMVTLGTFVCGLIFIEALGELKFQKLQMKPRMVTGFRMSLTRNLCN